MWWKCGRVPISCAPFLTLYKKYTNMVTMTISTSGCCRYWCVGPSNCIIWPRYHSPSSCCAFQQEIPQSQITFGIDTNMPERKECCHSERMLFQTHVHITFFLAAVCTSWALENMKMNLFVPQETGNFLTSTVTICISRRILFCIVTLEMRHTSQRVPLL
jgi:hypothetical protein